MRRVLLQFPFTTFIRGKQRPAVIVSTKTYNQGHEAGLIKEFLVKSLLFTVEKLRVTRKLGKMKEDDMEGISEGLREALGLSHAA